MSEVKCRVCECTETKPCDPPCAWQPGMGDLCTGCAALVIEVLNWLDEAHRPSLMALVREVRWAQKHPMPSKKTAGGAR